MRGHAFGEFFAAVHGFAPFPWQQDLARRLVDGDPPTSIVVPPGLGKTASLDAWVWALAVDIERHGPARTIPLRAMFVVDRRGIVDAAWEHAGVIATALAEDRHDATTWVADRLRSAGHDLRRPLEVVRMRGGVSWASRWLRQPDQPAVVTGTVDQFGSRFLFRGYGASHKMRPIDAALVGTDAVAFLDEAHLSGPLVYTVRDCVAMEAHATQGVVGARPVTIIPMTATPGVDGAGPTSLGISDDDRADPVAGARLSATKWARLLDLPTTTPANASKELSRTLAQAAAARSANGQVVLVVCNTIALAREVHGLLAQSSPPVDARLSIGRARELDKEVSRAGWWEEARANRLDRTEPRAHGLVVVSTQTIEVGADLDVDCMVTEAAPIDALIQRFGRIDRLGVLGATESLIVHHALRSAPDRDLVYGEATDATWLWLTSVAIDDGDGPRIDLGASSLALLVSAVPAGDRSGLFAPQPPVPVLYPALLDVLARTDATNGVDFPVDTYLHGVVDLDVTVSVVWRADLATEDETVAARLAATPPTTAEAVDIPIEHFKRFWASAGEATTLGDVDATVPLEPDDRLERSRQALDPCWRITNDQQVERLTQIGQLRPHDLVVVPAFYGGHDEYGWTGQRGPVVADIADLVGDGPPRLRLDREVLASLGIDDADGGVTSMRSALAKLGDPATADPRDLTTAVQTTLSKLRVRVSTSPYGDRITRVLDLFDHVTTWSSRRGTKEEGWVEQVMSVGDGESELILHAPRGARVLDLRGVIDDDDVAGSSLTGALVPLRQHLDNVGDRAYLFGAKLGLSDPTLAALRHAGRAHDLGKMDPRFQAMLRGGDWLMAAAGDGRIEDAVAKSAVGPCGRRPAVPAEWRWPRGMRHESISLALVRHATLMDDIDRDLVEHLVASHHGWSRPLFPAVIDDQPRKVTVSADGDALVVSSDDALVDWSSVGRFTRLCHRYGWWGLALLESVLRLADMAVSEEGS
jgi:CRISPR-associated endonuclease/helicase Cas3